MKLIRRSKKLKARGKQTIKKSKLAVQKVSAKSQARNEEIPSSDEDAIPEDVELYDDDFEETAYEKRHRLALEYVKQIKSQAEQENPEDVEQFVSDRLRQDYLDSSGRLQKKIADKIDNVRLEKVLKGHRRTITDVRVSSDENFLFSCSKDGVIIKFCLDTGKRLNVLKKGKEENGELPTRHLCAVTCLALTYDDKLLASADVSGFLILWNAQTCDHLKTLRGHYKAITGMEVRKSSHQLFTCSEDKCIKVWDLNEMAYVETLYGHGGPISCVDALSRERCVSVGGQDESMRLWKIPEESHLIFKHPSASRYSSGGLLNRLMRPFSAVLDSVAVINDQHAVTGSQEGVLTVWSFSKRSPLVTISGAHKDASGEPTCISSIAALRNADVIASGSHDGLVRLWKCGDNFCALSLITQIEVAGFVNCMRFSAEGTRLYVGTGEEHRLGRWWHHPHTPNNVYVYNLQ